MRDPGRIVHVLAALNERWRRNPDLRLGQLITNCAPPGQDAFYVEDDVLLDRLLAKPQEES